MNNKNNLLFASILSLILSYGCDHNVEDEHAGMRSSEPALRWQDALISGNGSMGILVYGDPENEKIIFNHEFCYEPLGTEDVEPPDIAKYLPKIRRLFKEGKYREAHDYSYAMAKKEGYPGLLWTDPYHPAFQMKIDQPISGEPQNYLRSVDFETGEITISWSDDSGTWSSKSFVSRPDKVVVQQISGDSPINCTIEISGEIEKDKEWDDPLDNKLYIEIPEGSVSSDWITFRQAYTLNKRGYESGTKLVLKGGFSEVEGTKVKIIGAKEILLLTRINYLEDFSSSELEKTKGELELLEPNYTALLEKHSAIHGEIFNRVKLDLFAMEGRNKTSEQFITHQKENPDSLDPAFLETMFNMGRYAFISSSGENPPNLMALWNGDWRPAWSGDFTLDANVNLQIAGTNIGNIKEGIESHMGFLERIAPDWEINSEKLYGCRGYLSGTRTSGRRNLHTHFDEGFPGHFWLAGAEWLLLPCYEYYQVSGDMDFLQNCLLPMMKKVVLFFEDFLTEFDENGKYFFAPSYSPENLPKNLNTAAVVNATMDIAAAKESIINLITVCKELSIESENIPRWQAMLEKMPQYLVNSDGALKEWATFDLEDNYNHRHVSHLYPVWPGLEINPEETPELFEAAKVAAQKRGRQDGSAFGLSHMALIGSRLKMDTLVYGNLLFMLKNNYIYRSLTTSHYPNRIYNADMLNSLPAVVMEMLVYSRPGVIELLPACSSRLNSGKISGVNCRTQATVESLEWNFQEKRVVAAISSKKDQTIELMYRKGIKNLRCNVPVDQKTKNSYLVKTKKGETINLEIELM
ncbi:MAG: glycoside hydrolase N-terminal domain-containing protein [Bacteroidia bacterium]|nr:glycoside hydrolase N-terminal domain-containing protein [Bacteroidia bacterium]